VFWAGTVLFLEVWGKRFSANHLTFPRASLFLAHVCPPAIFEFSGHAEPFSAVCTHPTQRFVFVLGVSPWLQTVYAKLGDPPSDSPRSLRPLSALSFRLHRSFTLFLTVSPCWGPQTPFGPPPPPLLLSSAMRCSSFFEREFLDFPVRQPICLPLRWCAEFSPA